ncbi:MAG: DUF883 domain-containing protein [Verrucomicrobia bacterium]|nr:DUF883 domain-containing protein [Verrucomicrobiota bacterium]MBV9673385.1 DUF883 domain-containing protein [Verrucomicrobiota bacterium]
MDENLTPGSTGDHLKDHGEAAAQDIKSAAASKANEVRQAAEKKTEELRSAAQDAWSDAQERAKNWQTDGEAYVRENPARAVLIALGAGFVLGLLFRK